MNYFHIFPLIIRQHTHLKIVILLPPLFEHFLEVDNTIKHQISEVPPYTHTNSQLSSYNQMKTFPNHFIKFFNLDKRFFHAFHTITNLIKKTYQFFF